MRVPDRWIPVVAATVGVLGGMGGALVGGYISNQTQEEQAQEDRAAAQREIRRETYATYLQAAERVVQRSIVLSEDGLLDDEDEQLAFIETEALPFFSALEAVHLVADDEVWEAAHAVDVAFKQNIETAAEWAALKQKFVDLAQKDIFPSE